MPHDPHLQRSVKTGHLQKNDYDTKNELLEAKTRLLAIKSPSIKLDSNSSSLDSLSRNRSSIDCSESESFSIDEGQVYLQEVFTSDYNVTEEEVAEYAHRLGINPEEQPELLALARDALLAPLPRPWTPVKSKDNKIYYFNRKTGKSSWVHPIDASIKDFLKTATKEREHVDTDSCIEDIKTDEEEVQSILKQSQSQEETKKSQSGLDLESELSKTSSATENNFADPNMTGEKPKMPPIGGVPMFGKVLPPLAPITKSSLETPKRLLNPIQYATPTLPQNISKASSSLSSLRDMPPASDIPKDIVQTRPKSGVRTDSYQSHDVEKLSPLKPIMKGADRLKSESRLTDKNLRFKFDVDDIVYSSTSDDEERLSPQREQKETLTQVAKLKLEENSSLSPSLIKPTHSNSQDLLPKRQIRDLFGHQKDISIKKDISNISLKNSEELDSRKNYFNSQNENSNINNISEKESKSKLQTSTKTNESIKTMNQDNGNYSQLKQSETTTSSTSRIISQTKVDGGQIREPSSKSTTVSAQVSDKSNGLPLSSTIEKRKGTLENTKNIQQNSKEGNGHAKQTSGSCQDSKSNININNHENNKSKPAKILTIPQVHKISDSSQSEKSSENHSTSYILSESSSIKNSSHIQDKIADVPKEVKNMPEQRYTTTGGHLENPKKNIILESHGIELPNSREQKHQIVSVSGHNKDTKLSFLNYENNRNIKLDDGKSLSISDNEKLRELTGHNNHKSKFSENSKLEVTSPLYTKAQLNSKSSKNDDIHQENTTTTETKPSSSHASSKQEDKKYQGQLELDEHRISKKSKPQMERVVAKLNKKPKEETVEITVLEEGLEGHENEYSELRGNQTQASMEVFTPMTSPSIATSCPNCRTSSSTQESHVQQAFTLRSSTVHEEGQSTYIRNRSEEAQRIRREAEYIEASLQMEKRMSHLLMERQSEIRKEHAGFISRLKANLDLSLDKVRKESDNLEEKEKDFHLNKIKSIQNKHKLELDIIQNRHEMLLEDIKQETDRAIHVMREELKQCLNSGSPSSKGYNRTPSSEGYNVIQTTVDDAQYRTKIYTELVNLKKEIQSMKLTNKNEGEGSSKLNLSSTSQQEGHDCPYGHKYSDIKKRYSSLVKRIKKEKEKRKERKDSLTLSSISLESSPIHSNQNHITLPSTSKAFANSNSSSYSSSVEDQSSNEINCPEAVDDCISFQTVTSNTSGDVLLREGQKILHQTEKFLNGAKTPREFLSYDYVDDRHRLPEINFSLETNGTGELSEDFDVQDESISYSDRVGRSELDDILENISKEGVLALPTNFYFPSLLHETDPSMPIGGKSGWPSRQILSGAFSMDDLTQRQLSPATYKSQINLEKIESHEFMKSSENIKNRIENLKKWLEESKQTTVQ